MKPIRKMRISSSLLLLIPAFCSFCFGQEGTSTPTCLANEVIAKPSQVIQPIYPPAAKAVRAIGDVSVFVTVNRDGKVLTTSVQNGHVLLKKVSENAASQSTFEPIKTDCQRVALLTFTFLTSPPERDSEAVNSPFHVQIFAYERTLHKTPDGKDPCKDLRFMALDGEAPTLSMKDALEFSECVEGKLIRVYGIYRVAFEKSDYYDPTGNDSSWLEFDPFYSLTKKCSSTGTLNTLNSKDAEPLAL